MKCLSDQTIAVIVAGIRLVQAHHAGHYPLALVELLAQLPVLPANELDVLAELINTYNVLVATDKELRAIGDILAEQDLSVLADQYRTLDRE